MELAAIREELERGQRGNKDRFNQASAQFTRAEEEFLKIKARATFLAARGTRANFERFWPAMLGSESPIHKSP